MAEKEPERRQSATGFSEVDGQTLSPCSNLSKVDGDLRCSEDNLKQILLNSVRASGSLNDHDLDADFHPSPYVLAHLSWRVYRERDGCGEPEQLPPHWQLLTTAASKSSGYFGAAYWNPQTQQIVIAHRGTNGLMDMRAGFTNVWSVALSKYTSRLNTAITFADKVRRLLNDVNRTAGASFQLSFTGHSLGGWLAQITCFSCKYLTKKGDRFIRTNDTESIHAHTVAFDSPGCQDMLEELKKEYDVRYKTSLSLRKLDITSYLSAPNRINTCNLHVGTVYRIFTDLSDMNFFDKHTFLYNLATHRMNKIVRVFDSKTGNVFKDANGKPKIQEVVDWPLTEYSERMWEEFSNFFKWANWLNDYHPEEKHDLCKDEGNTCIRYQTKEYRDNFCHLRIFTDEERRLLKCWNTLISSNKELTTLQFFASKHNMGDYRQLLPDFYLVDGEKIVISSSGSVKQLINRTKQLMRWFQTELKEAIKKELDAPTLAESMFKAASNFFVNSFIKYANFKDVINLKDFLENKMSERLLHIISEDVEFDASRIHNLCTQMERDVNLSLDSMDSNLKLKEYVLDEHQLFLPWKKILVLQTFVDITRILNSKSCCINLLVIVYPNHLNKSKDDERLLENIFSCVQGQHTIKKIIFITSKNQCPDIISLTGVPKLSKEVSPLSFKHLTSESQNLLISKPILELQCEKLSLRKLLKVDVFDEERLNDVIDSNILKKLLINDGPLVHQKYTIELSDQVFYVQVCKITSGERVLHFILNEKHVEESNKNILFMITGIIGNISKSHDELIKKLSGEKMYKIGDTLTRDLKERVFINTEPYDNKLHFKRYCSQNSDKRIYWLEVGEKSVTWKEVFDTDFYIDRKLYSQMTFSIDFLKKEFISEFVSDVFIFGNVSKENLIKLFNLTSDLGKRLNEWENILAFSDKEEATSHFEEISKSHQPSHLIFMEHDNKFIWQRSCGSLKNLRPYVIPDDPQNEQLFIDDSNRKLIILSGEAGMGKSTTLQMLSRRLKQSWVINIDLKYYNSIETFSSDVDFDKIVRFLTIGNKFLANDIMAPLFKESLRGDSIPVFIIFDGFDEVKEEKVWPSKEHQENSVTQIEIIEIIKCLLSKTTARVLIACRKFLSSKLENHFSVFSTTFEELKENQHKEFLEKLWWSRLVIELGCGKMQEGLQAQLKKYTRDSFEKAKISLGNDICTFMGVPLQLRMIAEVGEPHIRLFSVTQIHYFEPVLPEFNVFEMYKRFINIKYNIYFHENFNLCSEWTSANKTWISEMLNKRHRRLAFGIFFPDHAKEFLGNKHMTLDGDIKDEKIELLRVGLIRIKSDGNIDFLHRTFAEYFVADVLGNWINKVYGRHHKYPALEDFLVSKIMLEPQYKIVRMFLNNLLRQSELSIDSFKFCSHKISKLWVNKKESFFTKDLQTALHILTLEHCEKLIELFLGLIKTKYDVKDSSIENIGLIDLLAARDRNGETAVYIASKLEYSQLVEMFLNAIKYHNSSVKEKILLGTIFRQSDDKDDKHITFLLNCLERKEYATLQYQSNLITEKWQFISSLLDAAKSGDVYKVRENFHKLCKIKSQNVIQYLSVTDKCGKTALHLAAGLGKYNVVEYLVNHHANMNACDGSGKTPLTLAAINGVSLIVQYLVEQGADFTILDKFGTSPISWAAKCGHLEVVEYLADCGADICSSDVSGKTTLAYAVKSCNLEMVKYLAHLDTDINSVDKQGRSMLQSAIKTRSWNIAKYLIERGADLNICDCFGMNALQLAIKMGKWPIVNLLMEKGATIESCQCKGATLNLLVKTRKWDIIEALHSRGTDVNNMPSHEKHIFFSHLIQDRSGNVAQCERDLDRACYSVLRLGKKEFLKLLIEETGDHTLNNLKKMAEKIRNTEGTLPEEMNAAVIDLENEFRQSQ